MKHRRRVGLGKAEPLVREGPRNIRDVGVDDCALSEDRVVRDTIGAFAAQLESGRLLALDWAVHAGQGEAPMEAAAVTKVYAGELMERFFEAVQDMLGMEASLSLGSEGAILRGSLEQKLRHSLMWVISLGTNEIQRNLIAQRALGLPR